MGFKHGTERKIEQRGIAQVRIAFIIILGFSLFHATVHSSQLRDFESSATRRNRHQAESRGCLLGSAFSDIIADVIGEIIISPLTEVGGDMMAGSLDRVSPSPALEHIAEDWVRQAGDPDLPFFRADLSYQYVDAKLDGIDSRIETGYGPWALQVRHTRYSERDPAETLRLTNIHGLLRFSSDQRFEMAIGMGALLLDGERSTSGFSVTSPLNWYPYNRMVIRMAPTVSWLGGHTTRDYDISIGYVRRYLSLQSGYRWVQAGRESIHGPYIGFNLYY